MTFKLRSAIYFKEKANPQITKKNYKVKIFIFNNKRFVLEFT